MRKFPQIEHLTFLSVIYFFILVGYVSSLGFYALASLWTLLISFATLLFLWFFRLPKDFTIDLKGFERVLSFILIISITLALFSPKSAYEKINWIAESQFYFFLVAFIISLTFFFPIMNQVYAKARLIILILISILSKIVIVINSPLPRIDAYDIVQNAGVGVLHGQNPYTMIFNQVYENKFPDYFTYMPLAFLLTIPSTIIFGDVRYTFIFAELITCLIIYLLGKKRVLKNTSTLLMLILLYNPLGTFIIEQSWLDPLIILFFSLFGLLYIRSNIFLSYFFISFAFGIKQNMLFILPFVMKLKRFKLQKLILGIFPVLSIIIFFLFLSPKDFISDTIIEPYTREFRPDALTFFTFLNLVNLPVPKILFNLAPLLTLTLLMIKRWGSVTNLYLAFTIWFFSSLLFFKEAFLNQYYFTTSLIILTISFGLTELNISKK